MWSYPESTDASIILMMHYLSDAFVNIIYDDSSKLKVLNIELIGELSNGTIYLNKHKNKFIFQLRIFDSHTCLNTTSQIV